jgi:DNA-binding transcriptional LysR family regulator
MDRLEAMGVFVEVVDRGSFAAAARKLRCSPASVTRAVAQLEGGLGAQLLRRTTRSLKLTELGEQYVTACRRLLADVAAADALAAGEHATPRGVLAISAPVAFGRIHVRPVVDAFLAEHRDVVARLSLVDRVVDIVDEGVDVAVRIAELGDSTLIALRAGEVRRVACASPAYLDKRGTPRSPGDLARHDVISLTQVTASDTWTFGDRRVTVQPRLAVNIADAAVASALAGGGITCVLSYQVDAELRAGRLVRLLPGFEPPALPVHLVYAPGSVLSAKVRAFVDFALPRLRKALGSATSRGAVGA